MNLSGYYFVKEGLIYCSVLSTKSWERKWWLENMNFQEVVLESQRCGFIYSCVSWAKSWSSSQDVLTLALVKSSLFIQTEKDIHWWPKSYRQICNVSGVFGDRWVGRNNSPSWAKSWSSSQDVLTLALVKSSLFIQTEKDIHWWPKSYRQICNVSGVFGDRWVGRNISLRS